MKKIKVIGLNTLMLIAKWFYKSLESFNVNGGIKNKCFLIDSYYGEKLLIRVNPDNVIYYLPVEKNSKGIIKRYKTNFIIDGNWDKSIELLDEHKKTKTINEVLKTYEHGGSFKNTKAFENDKKKFEANNFDEINEPIKEKFNSKDDIDKYYKKNIELYEQISKYGYKKQSKNSSHWTREIGVAIGPNGEIYRYGNGYHRMAIARYLGLKEIPVVVKKIHKDWYIKSKAQNNVDPLLYLEELIYK